MKGTFGAALSFREGAFEDGRDRAGISWGLTRKRGEVAGVVWAKLPVGASEGDFRERHRGG